MKPDHLPALVTAVPNFLVAIQVYLVAAFFYGAIFTSAYGFIRAVVWPKLLRRPFPKNAVTVFFDGLIELLPNALGFINKVLVATGKPPLFIPTVPFTLPTGAAPQEVVAPTLSNPSPAPVVVPPDAVRLPAVTTAEGVARALGMADTVHRLSIAPGEFTPESLPDPDAPGGPSRT